MRNTGAGKSSLGRNLKKMGPLAHFLSQRPESWLKMTVIKLRKRFADDVFYFSQEKFENGQNSFLTLFGPGVLDVIRTGCVGKHTQIFNELKFKQSRIGQSCLEIHTFFLVSEHIIKGTLTFFRVFEPVKKIGSIQF